MNTRGISGPRLGMLVLVLALAGTGAAQDDDFLAPPAIAQAAGAFEQGKLERAEELALPLIRDESVAAEALGLLGRIRLKQNRAGEAEVECGRAVAKKPASAPLWCGLGEARLALAAASADADRAQWLAKARAAFERAESLDADCVDAQMGLLHFHLLAPAAGPAGAAERHAAAAARLDPLSATYDVAELAERLGRFDLAATFYGEAAKLYTGVPWMPYKRAAMLAKLGQVAEARAILEALRKESGDFPPAMDLLRTLPAS